MSHVCLCLNSCLMQLCKPMQMSSCHLSWLLGRINPKNDFFIRITRNRFGRNRYIYKKNAYLLDENLFFRKIYTCTLLFVVSFPMLSRNSSVDVYVITHVYLTVQVWRAVELARDTWAPKLLISVYLRNLPERIRKASLISIINPGVHEKLQIHYSVQIRQFLESYPYKSPFIKGL